MNKKPYQLALPDDIKEGGMNEGTERVLSGDELLNVRQAAAFMTISVPTMRRLQSERFVPFIKVGGSLRFLKRDLEAYITKQRYEPITWSDTGKERKHRSWRYSPPTHM